jgi:CheY-like chemotaxis protein
MGKKEVALFVPDGMDDQGIEEHLGRNGLHVSRYRDNRIVEHQATGPLEAIVIVADTDFPDVVARVTKRFKETLVYASNPGREPSVLGVAKSHGVTVLNPSDEIGDLSRRLGVIIRRSAQALPRALIVDDNPLDLEDMRSAIKDVVEVDTADSLNAALRLLEEPENRYAVVVSDLHLPKEGGTTQTNPENGLAVLEAVRRTSAATQSLVITDHFGEDDTYIHHHTALYRHGAVSFLSKDDAFKEPSILRNEVNQAITEFKRLSEPSRTADNVPELVTRAITLLVGETAEWVDLAAVGNAMRQIQPDFDHKTHGFDKLSDLIKSLSDVVEFDYDHSHSPPGVVVRLKSDRTRDAAPRQRQKAAEEYRSLFDFGFIFFPTKLSELADLALKEEWDDGWGTDKPILKNYLNHTFLRLQYEKKIFISTDSAYAVFNTGLVDAVYQPIFAFFTRNKRANARQPFFLTSFCRAGDPGDGQRIIRLFGRTPDAAEYFNDPADTVYDLSKGAPHVNWDHIFDNIDRLPVAFITRYAPEGFPVRDPETLDEETAARYKQSLQAAIQSDLQCRRDMTSRFQSAIDIAMRRVRWSFRTAVPSYYSTHNQINLLLPLSLVDDEKTDVVLVLERAEEAYIAHTILTPRQAYRQARVVSRPESEWLRL